MKRLASSITSIFSDFDGSFGGPDKSILLGSESLFDRVVEVGGKIVITTNRSPEACKSETRIISNFGPLGKWQNDIDFNVSCITATGTLILDRNLNVIPELSNSLSMQQREVIARVLMQYLESLSLIEWIEKDLSIKKNYLLSMPIINSLTKLIKTGQLPQEHVRKFHIRVEREDENGILKRASKNLKEEEHVIRGKKRKKGIQNIQFSEYIRRTPQDWLLRSTKFVANISDITNILLDDKKTIFKIILGFNTKDPEKIEILQNEIAKEISELLANKDLVVVPDLSNLHLQNKRDKAVAIKLIADKKFISLKNSVMIGNSGVDIPPGLLVAKNDGVFIYVGKPQDNFDEIKQRFQSELCHPLVLDRYPEYKNLDIAELEKNGNIIFHNPQENIDKYFD